MTVKKYPDEEIIDLEHSNSSGHAKPKQILVVNSNPGCIALQQEISSTRSNTWNWVIQDPNTNLNSKIYSNFDLILLNLDSSTIVSDLDQFRIHKLANPFFPIVALQWNKVTGLGKPAEAKQFLLEKICHCICDTPQPSEVVYFLLKNMISMTSFSKNLKLQNSFLAGSLEETREAKEHLKKELKRNELLVRERDYAWETLLNNQRFSVLGEMASKIGHEISNPLTIVLGKSEQAFRKIRKDPVDKEKLVAIFEEVKKASLRIKSIINIMKDLSRDAGNDKMEIINLQSTVEKAISISKTKCDDVNISFTNHMNAKSAEVLGRSSQLLQLLMGLLNNAFYAVEEVDSPEISIDLSETEEHINIVVEDNGPGIRVRELPKIYDPFYTTKPLGKSLGLGLSQIKTILQEHHGDIIYKRDEGRTQFIISMPRHKKANLKGAA